MNLIRKRLKDYIKFNHAITASVVIFLSIGAVQAKTPVSIELVIAVDTSMSVDGSEYNLLMTGIAAAFRSPEIINIIGQHDGVAVTLFQWNTVIDERYMIPWQLLKDPASILSFAEQVENVKRDPVRHFTGLGNAIDFGVRLIAENDYDGQFTKIDISGDGRSNIGISPKKSLQAENAQDVVINGLPILTYAAIYPYDLVAYYRDNVISGPGAFIEICDDYSDFSRAFLRKLRREITILIVQENVPQPRLVDCGQHCSPTL